MKGVNNLRGFPLGPKSPNVLLDLAKNAGLTDIIIIGWQSDDSIFMSSSYDPNSLEMLGSLEKARQFLHDLGSEDYE